MITPFETPIAKRVGETIEIPGIVTAHSHAFQRVLRGRTHSASAGTFWSWRGLMYRVAERMTPDDAYAIARLAYLELACAGVTTVGEFHYVHHRPDGSPYEDRLAMSEAMIAAARDVGIRIALLRVLYARAGEGAAPEGAQRRFVDADVDRALMDVDDLRSRYAGAPDVRVGLAPHSVRATPPAWLDAAARYADEHILPLHMHLAEQPREVVECIQETGRRPVELAADLGLLSPRFVAVHATHLGPGEAALLGEANAFVCVCRTTERDLGDGAPDLTSLREHGAQICFGVDSHALSDPFVEARAAELDERTRVGARSVAMSGTDLLRASSRHDAVGFRDPGRAVLRTNQSSFCAPPSEGPELDDFVAFSASSSSVMSISAQRTMEPARLERAEGDRVRRAYIRTVTRLIDSV